MTPKYPWLWPTLRRAKAIPSLIAQVEFICHLTQRKPSKMRTARQTIKILLRLSQEYSYSTDILSTGSYNLLTIANNTRLLQGLIYDNNDYIRHISQDIQYDVIGCIKHITTPIYNDNSPQSRVRTASRWGWKTETTYDWLL